VAGSRIREAGARVLGVRWQVQLLVAGLLAAAGVYMLVDPGRGELVGGLMIGGYLVFDGISFVVSRMGNRSPGRAGEIDALRAGVGLLTAALLFGLSFLDAITLTGVRLIIVIGGLPVGMLGLWLFALTLRSGARWGLALANVLVIAYAILLFVTQFMDSGAFGSVLVIVAGAAILVAIALALLAVVRARAAGPSGPEVAA
jgi:uncharacterized membrane protein HdeD (DUF308 family)